MVVDYIKSCEFNLPVDNMGDIPSNRNVPWNWSIETCTYTATTSQNSFQDATSTTTTLIEFAEKEIATTSDILHIPYISSGDLMIVYILLCIMLIHLLSLLARGLSRIKTKKTYLQYKGGDVEIRDDL